MIQSFRKIVLCPDSFKGSLSSVQACKAIAQGIARVLPGANILSIPIADGGEGTVEAIVSSMRGQYRTVEVMGPIQQTVSATYGILPADKKSGFPKTAVIEMASACGLPLVPENQRNPLYTTTYGLGQLILDAARQDCQHIILGIGGSATNDCGCGMAQALGVKFLDQRSNVIQQSMTGELMGSVEQVDPSSLNPDIQMCRFIVACDVKNPLLGTSGATRTYGPQKGADPKTLDILEGNMTHIITLIERSTCRQVRDIPGAGAAGGLGAGILAFLDATLKPGIELVLETVRFAQHIADADLIITGEGRIDATPCHGKTICGVCNAARIYHIPVIALAGSLGPGIQEVIDMGVKSVVPICPGPMTLEDAMKHAPALLADTAERILRLICIKDNS